MEDIICSCGCVCQPTQKFCRECGARLKNNEADIQSNISCGDTPVYKDQKIEPINIYPDDKDLKLLVDCCDKSGPLPTGSRYTEIVLYYDEKKDEYQVHKYASDSFSNDTHEGYYITKEDAAKIIQAIDADAILSEKEKMLPICGGVRVFKFRNDRDELVRIECCNDKLRAAVSAVCKLLYESINNEKRIVPEYAKSWKSCFVNSSGMSMTSCYSYYIERTEQGRAMVKGDCFINGVNHKITDWLELTEAENEYLRKIPLGLMLSSIVTKPEPSPINMAGVMGMMYDGEKCICSITYSDDRSDTKKPDKDMINALDILMKKVFLRIAV